MSSRPALYGRLGTILHVGTGGRAALADYAAAGARTVVLVEPLPDEARALRARLRTVPGLRVVEGTLSAEDEPGRRPFHVLNAQALSASRAPALPNPRYPGLAVEAVLTVNARPAAAFVAELGLDADAGNVLVLATHGEEAMLLSALAKARQLEGFDVVLTPHRLETLPTNTGLVATELHDCTAWRRDRLGALRKEAATAHARAEAAEKAAAEKDAALAALTAERDALSARVKKGEDDLAERERAVNRRAEHAIQQRAEALRHLANAEGQVAALLALVAPPARRR